MNIDGKEIFNSLMGNVQTAVMLVGGGMVAFGLISLAMNFGGGSASGNGASIGSAIGWMVMGVLICIAGGILGSLTFS